MRRNLPFLIFAAIVLAAFIALGNWQLRRMGEKAAYLAEIDARISAPPVTVPHAPDPQDDRFLAVRANGILVGPEIHVLVSTRDFGAGFRIIQAFETNSRRLLVDRGFIRTSDKSTSRPTGPLSLVGNLYWPDEIDGYTPDTDLAANIWYARDVPALARALGTEEVMIIARETSPSDAGITPLPVDTASIPNRHLEYVLTWYGLALTWVVMSLYFLRRRRGRNHDTDKGISR